MEGRIEIVVKKEKDRNCSFCLINVMGEVVGIRRTLNKIRGGSFGYFYFIFLWVVLGYFPYINNVSKDVKNSRNISKYLYA